MICWEPRALQLITVASKGAYSSSKLLLFKGGKSYKRVTRQGCQSQQKKKKWKEILLGRSESETVFMRVSQNNGHDYHLPVVLNFAPPALCFCYVIRKIIQNIRVYGGEGGC